MKRFFRIALKGTQPFWYDMEVPADANLPNFVNNVRMAGFVVHNDFYVPLDEIKHISVVTQEQSQQGFQPRVVN